MQTTSKYFIWVSVSTALMAGSYGCRQIIGWEEATYWGDGGSGGTGESSSSSVGGMAGAGGMAGMGGEAGAGGAGGAVMSGCQTDMDCPTLPNSTPYCDNGKCSFMCKAGFGNCTVGAGCETVVTNNKTHCGGCNKTCVAYCEGTTCNDPVSIAAGWLHHCAVLKNGDIYCWGRNLDGELGDGTMVSKSVPTKVKGLPGPAAQVDGGSGVGTLSKTCAALVTGDVWCWGEGNSMPAKVNTLSNIKEVSVGLGHMCALSKSGALHCWGRNDSGQVGNGTDLYVANPYQVLNGVSRVSAGVSHTCGSTTNDALYCWGRNFTGQLGIGSMSNKLLPTVVNGIAGVTAVASGNSHTCAIALGNVYCWGGNTDGQLGTGGSTPSSAPGSVTLQNAIEIAAGYDFSGAIVADKPSLWGYNGSGQVGNGMTSSAYSPKEISSLSIQALSLANSSSCALLSTAQISCWGANAHGQLGNNSNVDKLTPIDVVWK